jgi:hypothetical protein
MTATTNTFLGISRHHEWAGGGVSVGPDEYIWGGTPEQNRKNSITCLSCGLTTDIGRWNVERCNPKVVTSNSGWLMELCFWPKLEVGNA